MKRKCKNVDISDLEFIELSVNQCLTGKTKTRNDIVRIFEEYSDTHQIALQLHKEIINRKLELKPICYKDKFDENSQKWRTIGIQDIKQQMYDYIAVNGLTELFPRIGKYQCASIKGRGQVYCAKAVYNHIQDKSIKYACQFDIRKYYESVSQDNMMKWLEKHVKNEPLLWLIRTLLSTFKKGLSIGSYLSQHLANLYLSDLYHQINENMHRIRNKKNGQCIRVNLVSNCFFYMDDILIIGSNSRDLIKASKMIIDEVEKLGLEIKSNWRCFDLGNNFIDICGYTIYKDHVGVRRGTLKKMRRAFVRFSKKQNNLELARRVISYCGILEHSNCYRFCQKYNVYALKKKARKVVSNYAKNKKLHQTAESGCKGDVRRNCLGVHQS